MRARRAKNDTHFLRRLCLNKVRADPAVRGGREHQVDTILYCHINGLIQFRPSSFSGERSSKNVRVIEETLRRLKFGCLLRPTPSAENLRPSLYPTQTKPLMFINHSTITCPVQAASSPAFLPIYQALIPHRCSKSSAQNSSRKSRVCLKTSPRVPKRSMTSYNDSPSMPLRCRLTNS